MHLPHGGNGHCQVLLPVTYMLKVFGVCMDGGEHIGSENLIYSIPVNIVIGFVVRKTCVGKESVETGVGGSILDIFNVLREQNRKK